MKRDNYDILIVGGGPAGASTANYLSDMKLSVLLVERTDYENWRLGETLPPQIKTSLSALGVWPQFLEQKFSSSLEMQWIWGNEEHMFEYNFLRNPYGNPWHVDRRKFDRLLLSHARSSGTEVLLHTSVLSVKKHENGWWVKLKDKKKTFTVNCKFLVDASGQTSSLARILRVKRIRYDNLVGAVGICRSAEAVKQIFLVEAVESGWWYSCPISSHRLLVGYMTDGDHLAKISKGRKNWWNEELLQANNTSKRIGSLTLNQEIKIGSAITGMLEITAGDRWLAVGDAASSFDPLSGAGISKALHFAPKAAKAISAALIGDMQPIEGYAASVIHDFSEYRKQQQSVYELETRWPDSFFWKRRSHLI